MNKLPTYHKLSIITIGIFVFFYMMYLGREIIVPLTFAWIFAILLNPVVNFLMKKKIKKIAAISLAILLMMMVAAGVMIFIGSQASMFSDMVPQLKGKANELAGVSLKWISETFNVETSKINAWIAQQKESGMQEAGGVIGSTLGTATGVITVLLLMPVYIFLFLFYKPLLLEFITKVFSDNDKDIVDDVLMQTKRLIQNYLVGLLIEMVIVAAMNSTALLIIGIEYAVLLGVIGAILNLIPYIGGVIAISLPMIMGLMTEKPITAFYVLIAYIVIQIIDNNYLIPKIVASKVKVNALVSIVVVLIGGALWGVSGMFLSIPLTAIVKVVFDRIRSLEPFGYLIGDDMPGDERGNGKNR